MNTFTHIATTQADFQQGTLEGVVATAAGDLELPKGVSWTNIVNCTAKGNNLTKNSGEDWHAGAISVETISGNGYVETTIAETNIYRMIGLSNGNTDSNYTDIDFAICPRSDGALAVYEKGTYKGTFGTYASGDVLRVAVENGVVKYYKNGTLLYTSSQTPVFPLLVDTSIRTAGGTLKDVVFFDEALGYIPYIASGTYTSPALDISTDSPVIDSLISWNTTTPTGTIVKVETNISFDGGTIWWGWKEVTSGDKIPNAIGNLANVRLKYRVTLETTDNTITPQLHDITVEVNSEEFTDGTLDNIEVVDGKLKLMKETSVVDGLSFDNSDDYVSIPVSSIPSGNQITIEFWHYGQSISPTNCICAIVAYNSVNYHVVNIYLPYTDSVIYFDCGDNGASYDRINKAVTTNEFLGWHHWAFTKNATTGEMKIYLDGNLWHSGTGKTKTMSVPISGTTKLGLKQNGILKDYRIWNVARTQLEIQDNINQELTGNESGLVSLWKLDEGSGTTANDSTANNNDGTISGATWAGSYEYFTQGTYTSPVLDVLTAKQVSSQIDWKDNMPANTNIDVEMNLSLDGSSTWQGWQACFNDGSIPGIAPSTDLSNARLKHRVTLSTIDTQVTPELSDIDFSVRIPAELPECSEPLIGLPLFVTEPKRPIITLDSFMPIDLPLSGVNLKRPVRTLDSFIPMEPDLTELLRSIDESFNSGLVIGLTLASEK